jgi:hypothetical protein
VQLSVHYFDLALQRVKVKKSQLQLVAMCCTLLAGASFAQLPLRQQFLRARARARASQRLCSSR